uniref:Uncharacterized protein n=1 Tax=Knipowitschia caucasica TaxID=637954 RepID=A0AAV2JBX0_KNICA
MVLPIDFPIVLPHPSLSVSVKEEFNPTVSGRSPESLHSVLPSVCWGGRIFSQLIHDNKRNLQTPGV